MIGHMPFETKKRNEAPRMTKMAPIARNPRARPLNVNRSEVRIPHRSSAIPRQKQKIRRGMLQLQITQRMKLGCDCMIRVRFTAPRG